jgi:hypothetical protein
MDHHEDHVVVGSERRMIRLDPNRISSQLEISSGYKFTPMPRDMFPGSDEPVDNDSEPDAVLEVLLGNEVGEGDPDRVEPVLDA